MTILLEDETYRMVDAAIPLTTEHLAGDTKLLRTVLAVARMLCFQPKKRISKPKSARIELTYSVPPSYNDIDFSQVWPAPRMS